jgi:hypothetical protein
VDDGTEPPGSPTEPDGKRSPFEAPRLDRYDDMRDLLLADPIHDADTAGWPNLSAKK